MRSAQGKKWHVGKTLRAALRNFYTPASALALWGLGLISLKIAKSLVKIAVALPRGYACLRGMHLASYIVGQERRLVDPPSQWLLG
jgi:hypothetical protein